MKTFDEIRKSASFTDEELDYAINCLKSLLKALEPLGKYYDIVRCSAQLQCNMFENMKFSREYSKESKK